MTIPAYQTSVTFDVNPVNDGNHEDAETVVATLVANSGCGCGCGFSWLIGNSLNLLQF